MTVWMKRLFPSASASGYSGACWVVWLIEASHAKHGGSSSSALKRARKPVLHYASTVHTSKNNFPSCVSKLVPNSPRRENPLCMFISVYHCKCLPKKWLKVGRGRVNVGSEQPVTSKMLFFNESIFVPLCLSHTLLACCLNIAPSMSLFFCVIVGGYFG